MLPKLGNLFQNEAILGLKLSCSLGRMARVVLGVADLLFVVCKEAHNVREDRPAHTLPRRSHGLCQLPKEGQRLRNQVLVGV